MKYYNHPIAFPIANSNAYKNTQIDVESYYPTAPDFVTNSAQCYDFGITQLSNTMVLWMYCSDGASNGNKTGRLIFADIQTSTSEKNKYIAYRLLNNTSNFSLVDRGETHIGVYKLNNG